jgi:hypothetical protein
MQDWQLSSPRSRSPKEEFKQPPLIVKFLIIALTSPIIAGGAIFFGPFILFHWLNKSVLQKYDDPWYSILFCVTGIIAIGVFFCIVWYFPLLFDSCFWGEMGNCRGA